MTSGSSSAHECFTQISIRLGEEIRTIEIPPRPRILDRISAEMSQPAPNFKALAAVIAEDMGLAAAVLKVANSPAFGIGQKVRSISEALMILGLRVTLNTIAGIALRHSFAHLPGLEPFWAETLCTARVSAWLMQQIRRHMQLRPNDAYTFGLFRDAGVPALMLWRREDTELMPRGRGAAEGGCSSLQEATASIHHTEVGARLAETWLLHNELIQGIGFHHDASAILRHQPCTLCDNARHLIAVSHVADHLIRHHRSQPPSPEWDTLGAGCQAQLQLSDDALADLLEQADSAVAGD